ncbi:17669_t:CDS:1, partial [Cetraspora pellucida]
IVEIVSDNDNSIKSDIESKKLQPVNDSNFQFSFSDEKISDQCGYSSYAYWSWENLNTNLLPPCYTSINKSSQWNYGFINDFKQPYLYRQDSSSKYYVAFYEDYQSLNAKLNYIKDNNLAGIAIADITKDSSLINFISGNNPVGNKTSGTHSPSSTPSSSNVGAITGGVIGSLIFVSVLVAAGFILYRRRHEGKMSNPFIETNNQACLDTNPQVYSDINRQVRPDTNNRIFSDTNHKVS